MGEKISLFQFYYIPGVIPRFNVIIQKAMRSLDQRKSGAPADRAEMLDFNSCLADVQMFSAMINGPSSATQSPFYPTFPQNQSLPLQTILPVHSAVNLQNSAHIQSSKEMDSQGNRQKSHLQHSPNDISRDLMPSTAVLSKSNGKQVVFVDFLQKNAENISTCIPMAEAVVLPFPQVSNSSSRSNNTVPGASEAHTTFSPVETELLPQKTTLSSTSLVDPHVPAHTLCLPTSSSPVKSTSVEENS
ncbi:hypothetical protein LguiA_004914 [Lonicera macranthoides]